MKAEFWVKIEAKKQSKWWRFGSVECRKSKPATSANEVAVKMIIEIPDAYFETPELQARIMVPEDCVNRPVITPEIQTNISEMLREQLGVQVHIDITDTPKNTEGSE